MGRRVRVLASEMTRKNHARTSARNGSLYRPALPPGDAACGRTRLRSRCRERHRSELTGWKNQSHRPEWVDD